MCQDINKTLDFEATRLKAASCEFLLLRTVTSTGLLWGRGKRKGESLGEDDHLLHPTSYFCRTVLQWRPRSP